MEEFKYPPGLSIFADRSFPLSSNGADEEATKKAISNAAKSWHADQTQPKPTYTRIANVIIAADEDTVSFQDSVFASIGAVPVLTMTKDKNDPRVPVCFTTFAIHLSHLLSFGWSDYLSQLQGINNAKR